MFIVQHLKILMNKHKRRNTQAVGEITEEILMEQFYKLKKYWD